MCPETSPPTGLEVGRDVPGGTVHGRRGNYRAHLIEYGGQQYLVTSQGERVPQSMEIQHSRANIKVATFIKIIENFISN